MRIRPMVAWYDLWVGAFWDGQKRRLYVFPLPCLGVRIEFGRGVPSAPRPTHAANVVGTCDWGDCDGETVGVRLDSDAQWLAVCAQHSPVCRAMDAIWRLTCLPFSDNDRHKIQNIALAWIDGTGPREGSAVAQWLADPAPSAPPAECPNCGEPGDERYWKRHFHEGEWLCPRTPADARREQAVSFAYGNVNLSRSEGQQIPRQEFYDAYDRLHQPPAHSADTEVR